METKRKDIYNFHELEALGFNRPKVKAWGSFFMTLLQASGIFVLITFITFFIVNYSYVKNQIVDWTGGAEAKMSRTRDSDEDGIPDWWEEEKNLDPKDPRDAHEDPDDDLATNLLEYQFDLNPFDSDTDGDGEEDGAEIFKGNNPNGSGKMDADDDGMHDWWEEMYGLNKKSPKDATLDYDDDGLDNLEEFTYYTDPRLSDTDGDGTSDGAEVLRKTNPNGEGALKIRPTEIIGADLRDEDKDELDIVFEQLFGTDPKNSDTDGDGYGDYREVSRGYDPSGEGMVEALLDIPAIAVKAPIIWTQREGEEQFQQDLANGLIHYPDTAFPSFSGNCYITGHSSYYAWKEGGFKEVFQDLGDLKEGDQAIFHLAFKNGKELDVVYEIVSSEVVMPDDPRLFEETEDPVLTLVTCWPIGTDWKRLMVKGKLVSPEIN